MKVTYDNGILHITLPERIKLNNLMTPKNLCSTPII